MKLSGSVNVLAAAALPLFLSTGATSASSIKGVDPSKANLYVPSSSQTWKCLDGSKEIPWSAVNDDYCDCNDGSDEPGTSACPNGTFYCVNKGHIGVNIRSSRVGDGLCEPECCDGSDEPSGICPDQCESIGATYRAERERTAKVRKTGGKIRSTYLAHAQKEKKRLEESIKALELEVKQKKVEVERTQETLNQLESMDAAALEHKKQSPLFIHLTSSKSLISSLHSKNKELETQIDSLKALLDDLEKGYNPNYVDMAVINTVKAWKGMKGVKDESPEGETKGNEELPEEEDVPENYESEVHNIEGTDLITLLLDHEKHVTGSTTQQDDVKALLFSVADYLPDSFLPAYESLKEYIINTLSLMGVIPKTSSSTSAETSRARTAHNAAESALIETETKLNEDKKALDKLFAVEWYGKDGEWKKLDGTCLSKDTGEYTYSVCLFGSASQKSNKNGANMNLGSFQSWTKDSSAVPGSLEYYSQQYYGGGTKCWNGPERSVTLDLSCGLENEITEVSEPEKCEYRFVGTTPALCVPEQENKSGGKDEL
ncbi:hypothetical protein FRC02_001313 [Tulasnella sp. 418]|nr:hypothetical protein FRC02_001313 [Tulasnella sp. 418]